jgi:hypothetical protein
MQENKTKYAIELQLKIDEHNKMLFIVSIQISLGGKSYLKE